MVFSNRRFYKLKMNSSATSVRLMSELTEVLRADPDSEVMLGLLRKTHAFHDLLHSRVVAMLQLHRAIRAVHAIDTHLLILRNKQTYHKQKQVRQLSPFIISK